MARILSQALTLVQKRTQNLAQKALVPSSFLLSRAQSSRSGKNKGELIEGELIEIEIRSNLPEEDQGNPASDSDTDSDTRSTLIGIKRLEEAIQGVIVKRSAPDWLPFVPGASYWVPPFKKPIGVMELVSRVANERGEIVVMSEEESLSFSSANGYPSSTYFLEGSCDTLKDHSRFVSLLECQGKTLKSPLYFPYDPGGPPHPVKKISRKIASQTDDEES